MSLIREVTYRPDLMGLLAGTSADPAQFAARRVLPVITTGDAKLTISKIKLSSLLDATVRQRARSATYDRINMETESDTVNCKQYALEAAIDKRDRSSAARVFNLSRVRSQQVTLQLLRGAEKRVADLVFNRTTFPAAGNTGFNATNRWSDKTNATPIDDVALAKDKVRNATGGVEPDSIVVDMNTATNALKCDQVRLSQGLAYVTAEPMLLARQMIEQRLSQIFGLPNVIVVNSWYNSANPAASASVSRIWDDEFAMVFKRGSAIIPDEITEPGLGLTYAWNAPDAAGDFALSTYFEDATDSEIVRADSDVDEKILFTTCGCLIGNLAA